MFLRARTIRSGDLLTIGKKMKEELRAWRVGKKGMALQLVNQLHGGGLCAGVGARPGMARYRRHSRRYTGFNPKTPASEAAFTFLSVSAPNLCPKKANAR
jgi:hypothetical protein